MEKIRQHLSRRRSSNSSASLRSPTYYASTNGDKRSKNSSPRHLILTSNTLDFDQSIIRRFQAEGFDVEYIPFLGGNEDPERDRKELENRLHEREDDLEPGERYAVVAYNRPAFLLLASHHQSTTTTNPFPRLCALVTYYPDNPFATKEYDQSNLAPCVPPATNGTSSSSTYSPLSLLPVQIHLADHQSSSFWDNYSNNPNKKRHRCHVFFYPESEVGFAEPSGKYYDRISSRLAWSRALDCVKRGFGAGGSSWTIPDIETVWEDYWRNLQFDSSKQADADRHADQALQMMVGSSGERSSHDQHDDHNGAPVVNCVPTMVGGSDRTSLSTFYTTHFYPSGPPSQHIRLLSRTVGPDRIVDEVIVSFRHTEEIPWILPHVPPTDRDVRVPLVMTASFCAGKLAQQNLYWDQASVLVQVGLLDPMLIPGGFKATGKTRDGREMPGRLPVIGVEGAERVLNG
ncbi:hypothetical protein ASPWEDRAFT_120676 [Aspergillus wentii DTO 134E9]|uniref:Dienelactone hydrolase domain-containing protein n=1 Tax=Aspergillus wentii DTO 134E9 TaxID=1073089 RepID=A0A1L9R6Y9_ASPWE|nr:uncharacterized protein ASPWEDRAFT_120676 [Aspergillus wentii DTO 134E9]OJJ30680.1 hypothetical protein ASPWEDRAFT_120676 [Aspergillus wentii DTO 134E9]